MSKMKTSLYNQDGSLCSEAQILLSTKPTDTSIGEWKKKIKELKVLLSIEDLKEFERLKAKENNKRWRAKDPEKSKQNNKNWRTANPEKAKQSNAKQFAKWYANNHEKPNHVRLTAETPKKVKAIGVANKTKRKAKNPDYINNYHKQRKAEDPLYRFQCNMRSMGNRVVKQLSLGKKPACTKKWQGCTAEELKTHFESLFTEGMTWDNYGEWHVDHIRPVCSFSAEEWEQINHYTNLQPLWAKDNYFKIYADLKQIRAYQF